VPDAALRGRAEGRILRMARVLPQDIAARRGCGQFLRAATPPMKRAQGKVRWSGNLRWWWSALRNMQALSADVAPVTADC